MLQASHGSTVVGIQGVVGNEQADRLPRRASAHGVLRLNKTGVFVIDRFCKDVELE